MKSATIKEKILLAILLGLIAGIICSITKFGWEIPFPPRTPVRDMTNPPQQILEQLGFSSAFTHLTYLFNGNPRPIISFIMHFGFSVSFTLLYCLIAEFKPAITAWQGAAYGLVIWFAFHVVLLPLFGTVPAPWHQPMAEHFSEITGHMFCFWVAELARHDLRSRFTAK
ncbi:YagU family protein [Erwiniaceae bacterium CAU 1747]